MMKLIQIRIILKFIKLCFEKDRIKLLHFIGGKETDNGMF